MNKFLNVLKLILLLLLIIFNYLSFKNGIYILGFNHLFYLFFIGIFLILSVKDLIKKNSINNNKVYNLLCIIVLLIMIFILVRALYDPRFLYNNQTLMNELNNYSNDLYGNGGVSPDQEFINFFVQQNINYFLVLFVLLFLYRKLNLKKNAR